MGKIKEKCIGDNMILELVKFAIYSGLIVLISKYILVTNLRKLAENLNLKPKTVGNISGFATSIPELITISISSFSGLLNASIFNILSSNIINFLQYVISIISNKNVKKLNNKAIKIDIFLVIITILIPILIVLLNIDMNVVFIPIFIVLYVIFKTLNNRFHKLYLESEGEMINDIIQKEEEKLENKQLKYTVKYILIILMTGILLFVLGELLSSVIENLAELFKISQFLIGVLLGIVTSIPEFITFFESQRHYRNNVDNSILGVVEATNNLFTSNILNLFVIQSIGIFIYLF